MDNTETELEYDSWLEKQIKLLNQKEFEHLDVASLIEELEALGRAEKSAVKSLVYQIILHLLLIDYWQEESEYSRNHWLAEVDAFQLQLEDKLTTNLSTLAKDNLPRLYTRAKKNAVRKSRLSLDSFPDSCPYTLEDIKNRN